MITLPIQTARLQLRMPTVADAPTIAAYRDDPDVARYQDWPLPYAHADALEGIRRTAGITGPGIGRSVNVIIEHDGTVVGDLFVGIGDEHPGGAVAFLGYTLATRHQGKGFASEAAAAALREAAAPAATEAYAPAGPQAAAALAPPLPPGARRRVGK